MQDRSFTPPPRAYSPSEADTISLTDSITAPPTPQPLRNTTIVSPPASPPIPRRVPTLVSAFRNARTELPTQPPPLIHPSRLTYPTSDTLGKGAFGTVHAALLDGACPVAVKAFYSNNSAPSTLRARVASTQFRREAHRYTDLQGASGIVRFYGISGRQISPTLLPNEMPPPDSKAYDMIVTERLLGGSLYDLQKAHMRQHSTLSVSSVLRLGAMLANGLSEIHQRGFSHGDVKPANILFDIPPEQFDFQITNDITAKLIDFGLSRALNSTDESDLESLQSSSSHTSVAGHEGEPNQVPAAAALMGREDARGTPPYLAPEALSKPALRDYLAAQRADVYAWAIVMFELATGQHAWPDKDETEIFHAVVNQGERPVWPQNFVEPVKGFCQLVQSAWSQEFEERPDCNHIVAEVAKLMEETDRSDRAPNQSHDIQPEIQMREAKFEPFENSSNINDALDTPGPVMQPSHISPMVPTVSIPQGTAADSKALTEPPLPDSDVISFPAPPHDRSREDQIPSNTDGTVAPPSVHKNVDPSTAIVGTETGTADQEIQPNYESQAVHTEPTARATDKLNSVEPPELSIDEDSTSGGYEADGHSQVNSRGTTHGGGQSFESLRMSTGNTRFIGSLPNGSSPVDRVKVGSNAAPASVNQVDNPRSNHNNSSANDTIAAVPHAVHSVQHAFRDEMRENNCQGLCNALREHERDSKTATRALEALIPLLDRSDENCEAVAQNGGLRILASIHARHGKNDLRLCKSACFCIFCMASCHRESVERELRTTGACEIVLNSMRWHPADLPVVRNGACAVNLLCRASPELCSIIVELGGSTYARKALSRSANTFAGNIPVASAGLEIISAIAKSHTPVLTRDGTISSVLECCNTFKSGEIDEHCVHVLHTIVKANDGVGREAVLEARDSLPVLSMLIDRAAGEDVPSSSTLINAYQIIAELALSENKTSAQNAFLESPIAQSVPEGMKCIHKMEPSDGTNLAVAGLVCMRNMTNLGMDVCGSLHMSDVFDSTKRILHLKAHSRLVTLRAVEFLENIVKELRAGSYSISGLESVYQMLQQLQEQWCNEHRLLEAVRAAMGTVHQSLELSDSNLAAALESNSRTTAKSTKSSYGAFSRLIRPGRRKR